jgi:hypothetical protein
MDSERESRDTENKFADDPVRAEDVARAGSGQVPSAMANHNIAVSNILLPTRTQHRHTHQITDQDDCRPGQSEKNDIAVCS